MHLPTSTARQRPTSLKNAARGVSPVPCPEGCTCNRHHGYHFGGSKPVRTDLRSKVGEISLKQPKTGFYNEETLESGGPTGGPERRPEFEAKGSLAPRTIGQTSCLPRNTSRGVKRSSRAEYVLAPTSPPWDTSTTRGGSVPHRKANSSFVDHVGGASLSVFLETYWHPDPAEEDLLVDFYAENGWWANGPVGRPLPLVD